MKGREKFMKILQKKVPETPPVTLFIQHQGHFLRQIYPDISPYDSITLDKAVINFQKEMSLDVFVRILFDIDEPYAIPKEGVEFNKQTSDWNVKSTTTREGAITRHFYIINTPAGNLNQEITSNEIYDGTFLHACTNKPVKTYSDLNIVMQYEPECPIEFKNIVKKRVDSIKEDVGNSGIIGVWGPHGVFNKASKLVDMNDLYCIFLTEPNYYKELMEYSLKNISSYADAIAESGADVLIMGGNVAGGFLGKEMFEKYIMPYEKRFINYCHSRGIKTLYHNCGEIMNLVDSYVLAGADWVEPFSPTPLGDADLQAALEIVKGQYAITGGVDQVNILQKGTMKDVKRATEETLRIGLDSGYPFVLQSADFLERDTPIENIQVYADTAREILAEKNWHV